MNKTKSGAHVRIATDGIAATAHELRALLNALPKCEGCGRGGIATWRLADGRLVCGAFIGRHGVGGAVRAGYAPLLWRGLEWLDGVGASPTCMLEEDC